MNFGNLRAILHQGVDQFIEALEEEPNAEENFRFIEIAYREGKIDLLQLVVVQNDLVTAKLSYLDSLWDYWRAWTDLERAVGRPLNEGVMP